MSLYANTPLYLSGAYDRLGRMGLQYGRMLTNGYMNSRKAVDLRNQLVKSTKLFRLMMYYTRFDQSGNFIGTNRVTDDVYNRLLRTLIRTADVVPLPNAPKIFYNLNPFFVFIGSTSTTIYGSGIVTQSVDGTTNPIICNMAGNTAVTFVSTVNITGPKIWQLNNSVQGVEVIFIFTISGGLFDQQFPPDFQMSDPRWGVNGPQKWSPLDQGKYVATAFRDTTNNKWVMTIEGPMV